MVSFPAGFVFLSNNFCSKFDIEKLILLTVSNKFSPCSVNLLLFDVE